LIVPLIDSLVAGVVFFGAGGGAIEVRPVVLSLDLVLESDVRVVVAGVPVLGVDVAELADDMPFVGDFVGDCQELASNIAHNPVKETYP
jgi:hypothetical protein